MLGRAAARWSAAALAVAGLFERPALAAPAREPVISLVAPGLERSALARAVLTELLDVSPSVFLDPEPVSLREVAGAPALSAWFAHRPTILCALWIESDSDGTTGVFLVERPATVVELRRLPAGASDVPAEIETVALAVRSAAEALLERRRDSAPPTAPATFEVATPVVSQALPGSPVSRWPRLALRAGYAGSAFAAGRWWESGLRLDALAWWKGRYGLGLRYTILPQVSADGQSLQTRLVRHPVEVVGAVELRPRPARIGVAIELGLVADYVSAHTVALNGAGTASPDRPDLLLGFSTRVVGSGRIGHWALLFVAAGADAFMRNVSYVLGGDMGDTLLRPYAMRPRLDAGVGFELF